MEYNKIEAEVILFDNSDIVTESEKVCYNSQDHDCGGDFGCGENESADGSCGAWGGN